MIETGRCKVTPTNNRNAQFGVILGEVYEALWEMSAHTVPMSEGREMTYVDVTYRINGVQYLEDDFEEV